MGLGWGAVIGGDVTHYMIVLSTDDAVHDFGRNRTVHLGTELGISVGPMGIAASQQPNPHRQTSPIHIEKQIQSASNIFF
jgi:lipid-binding SYLF domain-containing protein